MTLITQVLVTLIGFLIGAMSPALPVESKWTMIGIPDTQHYAQDYPQHLFAMTSWIAEFKPDLAVHVGDVVDEDEVSQWEVASTAFEALDDADVPYVLSVGNHDFAYDGSRNSMYSQYFPAERMGLEETTDVGRSENGYRLIDLGGEEWLVLSIEMFPRGHVLDWAMSVLREHEETPTMLITHMYLTAAGERYGEEDKAYPHDNVHHVTGGVDWWDSETIYRHLVEPFSQVRLVLSGHVLEGPAMRVDCRSDGTPAVQITQNYQSVGEGGNGLLRVYEYHSGELRASTRSPVTGEVLDEYPHSFTVRLDRCPDVQHGPPVS